MAEKAEQPDKRSESRISLLGSAEGRILLMGVALAFTYTCWLGSKMLFSPEEAQLLVGMTATGIVFGRAAGMAFGYSLGLKHATVIPICMVIETVMTLVFFPLFVLSWRHLVVVKRLKSLFERVHKAAEAHRDKVQKYGAIGLFVFVWFPFWMTGPFVGSVIGFLLGLRVWLNIIIVLSGTYVAILAWALLMGHLHEKVASYSSHAATIIMVILLAVIIVGHLLHRTLNNHKNKA